MSWPASFHGGDAVSISGRSLPFWKLKDWAARVESKRTPERGLQEWYPPQDLRCDLGINAWLVGRASKNELRAAFALVITTLRSRATVDLVHDLRSNVQALQRHHGSLTSLLTRRERSCFEELGGRLRRFVRDRRRMVRAEVYKLAYLSNPPRSVNAEKPLKEGVSVAQAFPSLSKRQRKRTRAKELKLSILLDREQKKLLRRARAKRKKQKAAAKAKGKVEKQTRQEVDKSVDASVDWDSSAKPDPDMPALMDAPERRRALALNDNHMQHPGPSHPTAGAPTLPKPTAETDYDPEGESEDDDMPELEDPAEVTELGINEIQNAYPDAERAIIENLMKQMGPPQAGGPPGGSIAKVKSVSYDTPVIRDREGPLALTAMRLLSPSSRVLPAIMMLHQACLDMFFPIADETAQMMDTLKEWFPQLDDVITRRILKKYGPPPEDGGIGELPNGDMQLVMQVTSVQFFLVSTLGFTCLAVPCSS